jgi:two-component system nitrate/nitrite response regulator NarL
MQDRGTGLVSEKPRLLLVDDHDVVRIGTRSLLEDRFEVIGEADNAKSAIELAEDRLPDIVLLDVRLPGGGGAYVAQRLRETLPDVCIVAFTVSVGSDDVRAMMQAGVNGYLTKTTDQELLAVLMLDALAGARPVSKVVAGYLLDIDDQAGSDGELDQLTPREREVVMLIARGNTYREASTELGISVKTLESHMSNIFKKLGVASRHQLAAQFGGSLLRPDGQT